MSAALMLPACTTAAETAPRTTTQTAPAQVAASGPAVALQDASEKKICKRMAVMGSNFPKTVCSTAAEWAAMNAAAHESVDAYDKDRKQGNTQGSFENQ
ncbi:MAG: hypothetical protein Q8R02_09505 [Hyphomonadaceae bacterium]|nr:hypothetical protein [Hyphomonadaceae bacterium]